ncbi:MAG: hypothetical protein O7F16_08620 [Acidobacteria bacterium]|nr:hypothetical protein [Acidobacteriota bacterium]
MPSPDDGNKKHRFSLERGGRWGGRARYRPVAPSRRVVWLAIGLLLIFGLMITLRARRQKRRWTAGSELRVIELSPAPESALPLMPFVGADPDAEIEFKALLMRIPTSRQMPPALLSVHTLSGKLDEPITAHLGLHGEYELQFIPHYDAGRKQIVLFDYRFAPSGSGPEARRTDDGLQIVLEPGKPRRIDPPMEPESGRPLVLQLTGRLSNPKASPP